MLKATLRSLMARKIRLVLTALAIVLGVGFVAGTLVLSDTLTFAFDRLFGQLGVGIDVDVRSKGDFGDQSAGASRQPIPETVVDEIRRVPGVKAAEGSVTGFSQMVGKDGKLIGGGNGPPTLGVSVNVVPELSILTVRSGRLPNNDGEVAIDAQTAKDNRFVTGERIRVIFSGPAREFDLVGTIGVGELDSFAGASVVAFDLKTAQVVLGREGLYDDIAVVADEGVSATDLRARVDAALGGHYDVVTGASLAEESSQEITNGLGFFTTFLLVFAFVALFVGAFTIFNTFSIILAQRTRELALLRTLGASRAQVLRSVLLEALILGFVASIVGVLFGLGVAAGIFALLKSIGLELPTAPLQFKVNTVVTGLIVGLGVTLFSSLGPAVRSTRVAPIAALRSESGASRPVGRRRLVAGGVITTAGIGLLMLGLFRGGGSALQTVGLGALATFIGVAVLAPVLAAPLATVIGWPAARLFKVPGRLGRENAKRNPRRTAATAAALMIGLGLVGFAAIMAASLKASVTKLVAEITLADYIVESTNFTGFTPDVAMALDALPEVEAAVGVRFGDWQRSGQGRSLVAADGRTLANALALKVTEGELSSLEDGGLFVSAKVAKDENLRVGDIVPMEFARTGVRQITIKGVFVSRSFGDWLIGLSTFDANYTDKLDSIVFAKLSLGVDPIAVRPLLERTLSGFPGLEIRNQAELVAEQGRQVDTLLVLITALLLFAIIIAAFGIVNTLALSIFERTREIGLLRAVGMGRRQVRSMIRWEAVIISVLGAVLGLAISMFFGWAVVTALSDEGIDQFRLPIGQMVVFVVFAALIGMVAALFPARRAARLDVLRAITTE